MSAYVRRIAVLSAAFPDGWSVYPIQAMRGDRASAVPVNHNDGLPPGGAGAPPTTPQEADERASTGG